MQRALASALLCLLLFALATSLRATWAAYLVPRSLDAAIAAAPWNTDLLLLRARPEDLEEVSRREPHRAAPWIARGLAAETAGDPAAALEFLTRARAIDRTFQPIWTLAGFHARQGNLPEFWKAAREAQNFDVDLVALYRLALRIEPDPGSAARRLEPPTRHARRQWFSVVSHDLPTLQAYGAALTLARDLGPGGRENDADRQTLAAFSVRLAEDGHGSAARELRGALGEDAGPAALLSDPGFLIRSPGGPGWRIRAVDGVSALTGRGILLELTGRQPNEAELVYQHVPIEPGSYVLRSRYRFDAAEIASACRWRVAGAMAPLPSRQWTELRLPFRVAPGSSVVRVVLESVREAGSANPAGRLEVEYVRIEPAPKGD